MKRHITTVSSYIQENDLCLKMTPLEYRRNRHEKQSDNYRIFPAYHLPLLLRHNQIGDGIPADACTGVHTIDCSDCIVLLQDSTFLALYFMINISS